MQVAVPLLAKLASTAENFPVRHLRSSLLRKAETLMDTPGWTHLATGCCLLHTIYMAMPKVTSVMLVCTSPMPEEPKDKHVLELWGL